MRAYERIFSEEPLMEYSKACIDIALDLPSRDFDGLLIPSRGAFPFFIGIVNALNELGKNHKDYCDFNRKLNLPKAVKRYVKSQNFGGGKGDKNVLLIPFTADLSFEGAVEDVDESSFIDFTRNYWSQVTSNFLLSPGERKKDPHFSFFTDCILRKIENRETEALAYENFPKINKLAMIDTIISGRASSRILKCLGNLVRDKNLPGLLPHAYLIVDANGNKLKSPFKEALNDYVYSGKGSFHKISRILSEDEGAALEGLAAIVYPTIMKKSMHLKNKDDMMFIGAGSWSPVKENSVHNEVFDTFSNLVSAGIEYRLFNDGLIDGEKTEEQLKENFNIYRDKLVGLITNGNKRVLSCRGDFTDVNLGLTIRKIYESGSHVVHVLNDGKEINSLFKNFILRYPDLRYSLNH